MENYRTWDNPLASLFFLPLTSGDLLSIDHREVPGMEQGMLLLRMKLWVNMQLAVLKKVCV